MSSKVGVAIVNYKTALLVEECLSALAEANVEGWELTVCVVDNSSPDDSLEQLRKAIEAHNWGRLGAYHRSAKKWRLCLWQ